MSEKCAVCSREITDEDGFFIQGKNLTVCSVCAGKQFEQCPECGNYHCPEDLIVAVSAKGEQKVCFWCVAGKYFLCPFCRRLLTEDKKVKFHGYNICPECADKSNRVCRKCGKTFDSPDGDFNALLCRQCLKYLTVKCSVCGEKMYSSNAILVEHRYYCRKCNEIYLRRCRDCGKLMPGDRMTIYTSSGGKSVLCRSCLLEHIARDREKKQQHSSAKYLEKCVECDEVILNGTGFEFDGDIYCNSCKKELFSKCSVCRKVIYKDDDLSGMCPDCFIDHGGKRSSGTPKYRPEDESEDCETGIDSGNFALKMAAAAALGAQFGGWFGSDKTNRPSGSGGAGSQFCPDCQDYCIYGDCADDSDDCDKHLD